MKKNNSYLIDDEIDLDDILKSLWREKILILSISIICGLVGCLYAYFQPQNFKTEIKLKNPPTKLFQPYSYLINKSAAQFISDFKLNFLSLDNVEIFVEESQNLDNFKGYLKSKNITVKKYFKDKLVEEKEKNIIISNKYFLVFDKNLDGDIFLNNYAEFTKKKNITQVKKNLKLTIEDLIYSYEQALENAKLVNLENPILYLPINQAQVVDPEILFYKGTKILTQNIIHLKKFSQKIENEQFDFDVILDKASPPELENENVGLFFVSGLSLGFVLSLLIVFLKKKLKKI
jgi:LPS O-antigen subunit length determinant protein (WzzB/FepE family)